MSTERNPLASRAADERGTVLVLFALLLVVFLGFAAFLVDFAGARASRRSAQSIADLAALAGGKSLSLSNPAQACVDAITYLNSNAKDLSPKITPSTFCAQASQNVALTNCSVPGGPAQAKPTQTVGRYTVSVWYPVEPADIADPNFTGGVGLNDGTRCQRMGVKVTMDNQAIFAGFLGQANIVASRLAVVKTTTAGVKVVPSLWLLEPEQCPALSATGGSKITVGVDTASPPVQISGLVTIDSDGSDCTGGSATISATGGGTKISAVPASGSNKGKITLYAMPASASTCNNNTEHDCDAADLSAGRLDPQPTTSADRATRAPVDWRYNCKSSYPNYHGIAIEGCPDTTPAYIDNLVSAIQSGVPSGFQRWSTQYATLFPTAGGSACNPAAGTFTVPEGNWWIDCSSGFTVGNGTIMNFLGGNLIVEEDVTVSGSGQFKVNTANTGIMGASCLPTLVVTPCTTTSSSNAAFVYMRGGDFLVSGDAFEFNHTTLIQRTGYFRNAAGAAPIWSAPTEGPFKALALWSEEASTQYQIAGGASMALQGVFFTPEASFAINGGSPVAQQQAQFIARKLAITGGANLVMAPDLNNFISIPPKAGTLIR